LLTGGKKEQQKRTLFLFSLVVQLFLRNKVLVLLLDNVLTYGNSRLNLAVSSCVVNSFCERLRHVLVGLALKKSVCVKVTVEEELKHKHKRLLLAESALLQVALNLGSNAIKFHNKTGGKVELHFSIGNLSVSFVFFCCCFDFI